MGLFYSWIILAILFVARAALGYQFQSIASIAPFLVKSLHVNYAEIGSLIGVYMLPGAIVSLPGGLIGRHVSDRAFATAALGLMTLGGIVVGLSHGYALALAGRRGERNEGVAVEMLDHQIGDHGFEHRDFDHLSAAGVLAMEQRREYRLRGHQAAGLVGQDGRHVARLARQGLHQAGDADEALDDVIIGRPPTIGTVLAPAVDGRVDEPWPPRHERVVAQAPVLLLPRVLGEAECARLIALWHRPANVWKSADGFTSGGHRVEKGDFKVDHAGAYGHMTEYVVREPAVQSFLDLRFNRRVAPELRKAFQTSVSQREDYRIVRYDAATGGVLRPHRDNPTKETAHRRFTMTINLNAGEYHGGALRFREYGDHLYEVERGTAVVWSATLLHEVMPVTKGARFVLGVHMYGN